MLSPKSRSRVLDTDYRKIKRITGQICFLPQFPYLSAKAKASKPPLILHYA